MKTKTDLKKMKKDELVLYCLELQKSESSCLKEELEELQLSFDNLEEEKIITDEKLELFNDDDLFYSLKNNIDDIINNVSRETLEATVNNLKHDLDNLEKFMLKLRGVQIDN